MNVPAASGVPWRLVVMSGAGGGAWHPALSCGQPAAHPVATRRVLGCELESELAVGLTAPARVCLGWVRPSAAACSNHKVQAAMLRRRARPCADRVAWMACRAMLPAAMAVGVGGCVLRHRQAAQVPWPVESGSSWWPVGRWCPDLGENLQHTQRP